MRLNTFVVAVLAVTPFTTVTAQDSLQVKPGDRVRVAYECTSTFLPVTGETRTKCRTDEGTFRTIAADSLVLVKGGSDRAVPVDAISKFEVRVRQGHATRGAVIGALAGVAVAAGIGAALVSSCVSDAMGSTDDAVGCELFPVLTVPAGLLVGALVGGVIGRSKWKDVPLDQLRVSFGPQRGGKLRLGVSLGF